MNTTLNLGSTISSAYVHGFQMKRRAGYRDSEAERGRVAAIRLYAMLLDDTLDRDGFFSEALALLDGKHEDYRTSFLSTLDALRSI